MKLGPLCAMTYVLFGVALVHCQSTQGLLAGRVQDEVTAAPVRDADVAITTTDPVELPQHARTDREGYFSFGSLHPGTYNLRVQLNGYRASEVRDLTLPVSGLIVQNVTIRLLSDLWQDGLLRSIFGGAQSILPIYGPDVDLSRSAYIEHSPEIRGELTPSLSTDVSREQLLALPLAGRDPYALVVLQPNVTNDVGTQRGLGVSANGQRPSSTAYLLDGFQNNNYLTTGVYAVLPPEAIQEYRLSINNFSAEFGGTSGYIANAITESSSNAWHSLLYADLTNQTWNSENVQSKTYGQAPPAHQLNVGGITGGAIMKNKLFATSSLGGERSRNSSTPVTYLLPTRALLQELQAGTNAHAILTRFPGPVAPGSGDLGSLTLRPTVTINQLDALERFDLISNSAKNHSSVRLLVDRLSQPDFIWTPNPAFTSGLHRNDAGVGFSSTLTPSPDWSYDFRAGFTLDANGWDRAHPEIPLLLAGGFTLGSPASYTFRNKGTTYEASANFAFTKGANAARWGASFLQRRPAFQLTTPGAPTEYIFPDTEAFLRDNPSAISFAASRAALASGNLTLPNYDRSYRYWQLGVYWQDTYRVSQRFLINVGLRYEYFSPPINIGTQPDSLVQLGTGASLSARLENSTITPGRQIFTGDPRNFGPRFGFAYNLPKYGGFVLRGSYGIFYDRPFDNLWVDTTLNDSVPASLTISGQQLNYFNPASSNLQKLSNGGLSTTEVQQILNAGNAHVDQTLFQPGFRSPYVQSYMLGLQKRISSSVSLDVNYSGSLGHELVTTDVINRFGSTCKTLFNDLFCIYRFNDALGDIDYRANQGDSSHQALVSSLLIRNRSSFLAINYTWSHTIDNQSEPLAGFAANLAEANLTGVPVTSHQASFTRQFDSRADRGNSDFDQRHVLAAYFSTALPSVSKRFRLAQPLRNWRLSGVATVHSGSFFTVYAIADTSDALVNNRSDLLGPARARINVTVPQGKIILNSAAFGEPVPGQLGTSGRNSFQGPGSYNFDLSVSRNFILPFSERVRVTLRADAFNLLNHANLNNPVIGSDSCCGDSEQTFGLAAYGRGEFSSAIPLATPLSETAREIHFVLRLAF